MRARERGRRNENQGSQEGVGGGEAGALAPTGGPLVIVLAFYSLEWFITLPSPRLSPPTRRIGYQRGDWEPAA